MVLEPTKDLSKYVTAMESLAVSRDVEAAHSAADDLLTMCLRVLGQDALVDAYHKVAKEYA